MLQKYKTFKLGRGAASKSTVLTYLTKLEQFKFWLGKPLKNASPADLDRYLVYLKSKASKVSRNTLKLTITALRSFYTWLAFEYSVINIAQNLTPVKEYRVSPEILTISDVHAMIVAAGTKGADALRNAAIIIILADTGIRVSELINIKIGHIKVNKTQLILKVTGTKTYQERQIPFCFLQKGGLLSEVFMAYYKQVLLLWGRKAEDYLFKQSDYYLNKFKKAPKQLTRNSINYLVKKLAKQAGIINSVSPHSFRHFYATYLVVNGENIQTVSSRLGHRDISKTMIYIHYADIIKAESSKNSPLAGIKTSLRGFVN